MIVKTDKIEAKSAADLAAKMQDRTFVVWHYGFEGYAVDSAFYAPRDAAIIYRANPSD